MVEGSFKYEDDLLKHYVRKEAWLPLCKKRLDRIKRSMGSQKGRRLRYFTFTAAGAIDVLMLDVAKIISRSGNGKFDTVCFFDRTPELIVETRKRIPGAIGFPGEFAKIVLIDDPLEHSVINGYDPLESPLDDLNEAAVRTRQAAIDQRHKFIECFPFDVINLDLEEFMFKRSDPLPGKLINAFRKLFEWQRRPLRHGANLNLDGFSLMFTTQIGPPNMSDNYLKMLYEKLDSNIGNNSSLVPILRTRTGFDDISSLQKGSFETFFKLALPKVLASILMEQDWYIDPETSVSTYEFERSAKTGPYKMLHLVMDVRRMDPPLERRAPGTDPPEVTSAYRDVVHRIFTEREIVVNHEVINKEDLEISLRNIKGRRKKYYPDNDVV
jgi:hypothetical protein